MALGRMESLSWNDWKDNPVHLSGGQEFGICPGTLRNLRELGIDVDPAGVEITPLKNNERLVDSETSSSIMDGHIITFKTSDPVEPPLPHRDLIDTAMLTDSCFAYAR